MRASDEDALICDFAQYYHIYDLEQVGVRKAAILACGLPEESRTMKRLSGNKLSGERVILVSMLDTIRSIEFAVYQSHSKKKIKKPKPLLKKMMDGGEKKELLGYGTAQEFEEARKKFLREM
ncbi:MAG: hypothetical protein IJ106_10510 [Parasporobacterium sp.]|nr:hypothetical protein [Parasporobacterium sp.]